MNRTPKTTTVLRAKELKKIHPSGSGNVKACTDKLFSAGGNLSDMQKRREIVSHRKETVSTKEMPTGEHVVTFSRKSSGKKEDIAQCTIYDLEGLQKSFQTDARILNLLLYEMNLHLDFNSIDEHGLLINNRFSFPVSDITSLCGYSSYKAAEKALYKGFWTQYKHPVETKRTLGASSDAGPPLFTYGKIKSGTVIIEVRPDKVYWEDFFSYWTYEPDWVFRCSYRLFCLVQLVSTQGRQSNSQKQLIQNGVYTVSMWQVWEALNLPYPIGLSPKDEEGKPMFWETNYPTRDIVKPVENCIDELNRYENDESTSAGIRITLGTKSRKSYLDETAKEFLNDGILYVELSGEYLEAMTAFGKKRDDAIRKKEKQKQKALERKAKKNNKK